MSNQDDAIIIKFENKEYIWHRGIWTTKNYLTINTYLAQQLSLYCIKEGILTKEDFAKRDKDKV